MGTTQKNVLRDRGNRGTIKTGKNSVVKGNSKLSPQQEQNARIRELIEKSKKK